MERSLSVALFPHLDPFHVQGREGRRSVGFQSWYSDQWEDSHWREVNSEPVFEEELTKMAEV